VKINTFCFFFVSQSYAIKCKSVRNSRMPGTPPQSQLISRPPDERWNIEQCQGL